MWYLDLTLFCLYGVLADVMFDLYSYVNPRTGTACPLLSEETWAAIEKNKDVCACGCVVGRAHWSRSASTRPSFTTATLTSSTSASRSAVFSCEMHLA